MKDLTENWHEDTVAIPRIGHLQISNWRIKIKIPLHDFTYCRLWTNILGSKECINGGVCMRVCMYVPNNSSRNSRRRRLALVWSWASIERRWEGARRIDCDSGSGINTRWATGSERGRWVLGGLVCYYSPEGADERKKKRNME